jgi:putative thioredoxin
VGVNMTNVVFDATDQTFQADVIERSKSVVVVVDLWAEWCGPCKTLGPILEKVVAATGGKVVLAKVDVDANPAVARAFQVQSIPAVYALRNGQVIDTFTGALPEHQVSQWVAGLLPTGAQSAVTALLARGDEASLRQALELEPGNEDVVVALAQLLIARTEITEALALLQRVPETDRVRKLAAEARLAFAPVDDYDATLETLLASVKTDEEARRQFLDILESMGPGDPRTAQFRRRLTAQLF